MLEDKFLIKFLQLEEEMSSLVTPCIWSPKM